MPTYRDDPDYDLLPSDYEEMERIAEAARRLPIATKVTSLKAGDPMWRDHNCWKCREGQKVCPQGGSHRCDYPIAKNH